MLYKTKLCRPLERIPRSRPIHVAYDDISLKHQLLGLDFVNFYCWALFCFPGSTELSERESETLPSTPLFITVIILIPYIFPIHSVGLSWR
jgi:hypothetical protein